jgi:integrase
MSQRIHRLNSRMVATAQPPQGRRSVMLNDGGNLLLQVSRSATDGYNKSWTFRYQFDGKRHDLGLGSLNSLDLGEARAKARGLRQLLLDGVDPAEVRERQHADRRAKRAADAKQMTFRECAIACIASHEDGWRNAEHRRQWRTSLETYVFPLLGDLPVDQVDTAHVVRVLEPIWKTKSETASRVRGRIEKVLGWATVRGFRSGDNPARWRGHLQELFASKGKLQPVNHHVALPYMDLPTFMAELRDRDGFSALALQFAILTAARSSEVLGARWDEIDFVSKMWTVPASRMKAHKEHRVPLSDTAMNILASLPREGTRIFPLTHTAMLELLRRMGHENITVHGFRSTFRDWCAERTSYPNHVAEAALAHAIGDKVEKAYRRGDLLEKRRKLMDAWATWCAQPAPSGATVHRLSASA